MAHGPDRLATDSFVLGAAAARTLEDLAVLLRALRRRHARDNRDSELTYRELAMRTGWSPTAVAEYFTARTLPPTERFDALVGLLGATSAEQGALATARDRIAEQRRIGRAARNPTPPTARGGPVAVLPRQLPAVTGQFVGRAAELAELARLVDRPTIEGTVLISAIGGTAGVGKTTLAVHWAHQVAGRFPDGQLYVNLRGFGPSGAVMTPAAALRGFLKSLQVSPERVPTGLDELAALYRSLLAGRRMLILLDNARDTVQVRPLLPGSAGSLVLVTSRSQLVGLVATDGAHPIALDLLTRAEARELLARRLGAARTSAEPEAVEEIITRCARLPLALAVVAARATAYRRVPLSVLARELRDSRDRLAALTADDPTTDPRAVFSWSYHALTPDAARLFRLLGTHPGPDISTAAAASLAGVVATAVRPLLAELVRGHLISESVPGRYACHDLLRAYAAEQAEHADPDAVRAAGVRRTLDHCLHTGHAAALLLNPHRATRRRRSRGRCRGRPARLATGLDHGRFPGPARPLAGLGHHPARRRRCRGATG